MAMVSLRVPRVAFSRARVEVLEVAEVVVKDEWSMDVYVEMVVERKDAGSRRGVVVTRKVSSRNERKRLVRTAEALARSSGREGLGDWLKLEYRMNLYVARSYVRVMAMASASVRRVGGLVKDTHVQSRRVPIFSFSSSCSYRGRLFRCSRRLEARVWRAPWWARRRLS